MGSDQPTLVEYLLAKISTEEKAAHWAYGCVWEFSKVYDGVWSADLHNDSDDGWSYGAGDDLRLPESAARFMAVFEPARVLADCAARRAIIGLHTMYSEDELKFADGGAVVKTGRKLWYCGLCEDDGYGNSRHPEEGCATLLALVAPYVADAGFNPDWVVE